MSLSKLRILKQLFIGGKFVNPIKNQTFDVINPADESVLATIGRATKEDVDLAVKCAGQAYQNGLWSRMAPTARANCLFRLADLIQKNSDDLSTLQAVNNGKPQSIAKAADLELTHTTFRHYGGWVDKICGKILNVDGPYHAYTTKEPVGVVGQIVPWNFPLFMATLKIAPALAAGCTVVLKSAQQTPLTALRLGELISQAGIPDGVVNILSGYGDIGAYLVRHPGIDKVSFTGSTEVGYDIMRNCHQKNLKRVTLQLGGKSANIITSNADLQNSLCQSTLSTFFNAGQCCIAGSRTFVHSSIYDKYISQVAQKATCIKIGNPLSADTDQGPLVSKQQLDKVLSYIQIGKKQGAKLLVGGKRVGNKGYFVQPTIFTDVKDDMTIAKEEIFGPVMSILKYDTLDQVIHRSNNTPYGLGAGIVSQNFSEVQYLARRLKAGVVYVNCYNIFTQLTPFGGYKDSGIGRQTAEQGLNNFLEIKTVIMNKK